MLHTLTKGRGKKCTQLERERESHPATTPSSVVKYVGAHAVSSQTFVPEAAYLVSVPVPCILTRVNCNYKHIQYLPRELAIMHVLFMPLMHLNWCSNTCSNSLA